MTRHSSPLPRRLAPLRRAAATAGVTAATLVVCIGGYSVATSATLAEAPGDRVGLADYLTGPAEDSTPTLDGFDPTAAVQAREDDEEASRSRRAPAGLPSTAAQAQQWQDEVAVMEDTLDRVAAERAEAARVAAEQEAARVAAEAEAARVAAEAEAARVAAEQEAARVAAEAEAARVAAEAEEAAAAERAAQEAADARAAAEREASRAASAAISPGSNRALGQQLLGAYGFGSDQWSCLDNLWTKESGWDHLIANKSSGAYGIPQSLPGNKMASVGSDWQTNPETQIRWGLNYISGRYGTPCAAWAHSQAVNWY